MNSIKTMMTGAALVLAVTMAGPVAAQESSYKPGTVWQVSEIKVLPGQFENYMDYLATTWKKVQEAGKADGMVVSYHVLSLDNSRQNEPDLVLVIEYKDYLTTAQQEAMQKKVNALLAQDNRMAATASAGRAKMREPMGSQAYQELILK
jgi:hypothetical protein